MTEIFAKDAYMYCHINGQDSNMEVIIAKSAFYSYQYAKHILKDRFILGEPAILNIGEDFFKWYLMHVENI